MTLTIFVPGRPDPVILDDGDGMLFGRDPDDPTIGKVKVSSDLRVHGEHGRIDATGTGWSVSSLGRFRSFTVYDRVTPSRIAVPLGVGPILVPFPRAIVSIGSEQFHIAISVACDREPVPGWAAGWSAHMKSLWMARGGNTVAQWKGVSWQQKNGRPYAWFKVLVALCQPRLEPPFEDRVPTNDELAKMLGMPSGRTIEREHIPKIRGVLGLYEVTRDLKSLAATIAIAEGIVTPDDLQVLRLNAAHEGSDPANEEDHDDERRS